MHSYGITIQPEFYHEINDSLTFQLTSYMFINKYDDERTHFDFREFYFHKVMGSFEASAGLKKIYWGAVESLHLVDIINQTDGAMGSDGEDKLGQPMIHFSYENDFGLLDAFVLPYFRERTFRGPESRLRPDPYVYSDHPIYEDSREDEHIDYAIRYLATIGDLDFALSYFEGTSRDPLFDIGFDDKGMVALVPTYEQISQIGTEAQLVVGDWLLKYESIYRCSGSDINNYGYTALVGGFEYSFYGVFGSKADIGFLSEYLYDDRGEGASTLFEDDVMGGVRIALNDYGSTEFLGGVIQDLSTQTRTMFVESSRRFGDNVKVTLEVRIINAADKSDPFYQLRQDDHGFIEAAYYF